MSSRIANKENLSLAYFVVRSQSLFFYREILKTLNKVDPHIAKDIKYEVCVSVYVCVIITRVFVRSEYV